MLSKKDKKQINSAVIELTAGKKDTAVKVVLEKGHIKEINKAVKTIIAKFKAKGYSEKDLKLSKPRSTERLIKEVNKFFSWVEAVKDYNHIDASFPLRYGKLELFNNSGIQSIFTTEKRVTVNRRKTHIVIKGKYWDVEAGYIGLGAAGISIFPTKRTMVIYEPPKYGKPFPKYSGKGKVDVWNFRTDKTFAVKPLHGELNEYEGGEKYLMFKAKGKDFIQQAHWNPKKKRWELDLKKWDAG